MKKLVLVFSACAVLFLAACQKGEKAYFVSPNGSDAKDGRTAEKAFATLGHALDAAIADGKINKVMIIGTLNADTEGSSQEKSEPLFRVTTQGKELIIAGYPAEKTKIAPGVLSGLDAGRRVISVDGNSIVTFENIEISGGSAGIGGGLLVTGSSKVTIGAGVVIRDNESTNSKLGGGGIAVQDRSELIMNAGAVKDNKSLDGGGIYVTDSSFTMEGGEVSNNTGRNNGGGVYIDKDGIFTLKGGAISENTCSLSNGGGVLLASGSKMIMSGGEIRGNYVLFTGGGVSVYVNSSLEMSGGKISGNVSDNYGGGLQVVGTFTMSGGEISENETPGKYRSPLSGNGAGLFAFEGTAKITGGTIKDNKANVRGGGIYLLRSRLDLEGGEISGNTAKSGGAVYRERSTFNRADSVIISSNSEPEIN